MMPEPSWSSTTSRSSCARFARVLVRAGHEVVQASDGNEAVALVAKRRFDCAFVDLGLPGDGGLAGARLAAARDPELPVILMTGAPTLETAIGAVAAGALRYLVKPIDSPDLQTAAAMTPSACAAATTATRHDRREHDDDRQRRLASIARSRRCSWSIQPIVRYGRREVYAYEALVRTRSRRCRTRARSSSWRTAASDCPQLGRRIRGAVAATAGDLGCAPVREPASRRPPRRASLRSRGARCRATRVASSSR